MTEYGWQNLDDGMWMTEFECENIKMKYGWQNYNGGVPLMGDTFNRWSSHVKRLETPRWVEVDGSKVGEK